MTNVVSIIEQGQDLAKIDEVIKTATVDDLKVALTNVVQATANHIAILAKIWRELENRGEDLSALRSGIAYYLPMVADNKLDASVVLAFAGQQLLLRQVSLLPIEQQKSLAEGEKVPVVTISPKSNEAQVEYLELKHLHSRHYNLVFDLGRVRTPEEQEALLRTRATRRSRVEKKVRKKKVRYDSELDAFVVGATKIRQEDVLTALAELSGKSEDEIEKFLNLTNTD